MLRATLGLAVAALGISAIAEPALAQNEQFLPSLVYRTTARHSRLQGTPASLGRSASLACTSKNVFFVKRTRKLRRHRPRTKQSGS